MLYKRHLLSLSLSQLCWLLDRMRLGRASANKFVGYDIRLCNSSKLDYIRLSLSLRFA